MEKPYKNGWFGGTTILGNIQKNHVDPPSWNSLPKSFQGDFLYGCMNFGVSWALGPIA